MSSAQAPQRKAPPAGAPAWMGTFADLMSLLMCFFVLLLSFSEMDVEKFKQIAASMKMAFGVQRDVVAEDIPMGTSIIAQEFSAGKPTPTVVDEVRQQTMEEEKQTLEFTDALVNETDAVDETDRDAEVEAEAASKAEADAEKLREALREEIRDGMIQVEAKGATIVIRIREKGSFPSGLAEFSPTFLPVLSKLEKTLAEIEGRIVVAGHTDNIPIRTARFRSNWDLSAARAVTVVHRLTEQNGLDEGRFLIEGHADTEPLVANDSAANRALNRRVELTIMQGEQAAPEPVAVIEFGDEQSDTESLKATEAAIDAVNLDVDGASGVTDDGASEPETSSQ